MIDEEDMKIQFLYKYRPLSDEANDQFNENTLNILRNGELYFSQPRDFNDPIDCRVEIDTEGTQEEIRSCLLEHGANQEVIEKSIRYIKSNEFSESELCLLENSLRRHLRIFCLSKQRDNPILWSHYADKHTGICIGFKTYPYENGIGLRVHQAGISEGFCLPESGLLKAEPVRYQREQPLPYRLANPDKFAIRTHMITKSDLWKYEEEFRIILNSQMIRQDSITVDTAEIGEVIFGLLTKPKHIDAVRDVLHTWPDGGVNVELYQCRVKKRRYSLEIVELG